MNVWGVKGEGLPTELLKEKSAETEIDEDRKEREFIAEEEQPAVKSFSAFIGIALVLCCSDFIS